MAGLMGNCGFAVCATKESYLHHSKGDPLTFLNRRYGYFKDVFKNFEHAFPVSKEIFNLYSKRLIAKFSKWKDLSERATYLKFFSSERWQNLTVKEKSNHRLKDCSGCQSASIRGTYALFEKNCGSQKKSRQPLKDITNVSPNVSRDLVATSTPKSLVSPVACSTPFTMKDAAKNALSQMKKTFKENYGEDIFTHLQDTPEIKKIRAAAFKDGAREARDKISEVYAKRGMPFCYSATNSYH